MRQFNKALIIAGLTRAPYTREITTPKGDSVFVMEATVAVTTKRDNGSDLVSYLPVGLVGPAAKNLHERIIAAGNAPVALILDGVLHREVWEKDDSELSRLKVKVLHAEMADSANLTFSQDAKGGWRLDGGTVAGTAGGNLTRDVELRYTPAGDAVADLDIAMNNRFTNRAGQVKEETTFVRVTLWRELALQAEGLKKGTAVITEGFLTSESWKDKETDETRSVIKLEGTKLTVIATPVKADGAGTSQPVAQRAATRAAPTPPGSEPITEDMLPPTLEEGEGANEHMSEEAGRGVLTAVVIR